jgi:hypothetical protein
LSIAVLNWVWANSPTSGNERLVLLALADACSRDDGSGCWPAARTIAAKANISDRTVRRVIARLEADGRLLVHRGGGRAGSTNSYTVVMAVHSPGHIVTPDITTGVTPVSGEGCHPCPGTPDTAVSPDPPENHQRTTTDPARDAASGDDNAAEEIEEFFTALGARWLLTVRQRQRLSPAVRAAVASGWTLAGLARFAGANPEGVRSPYAVLRSRLSPGELPLPPAPPPDRPPWCGSCDEHTRHITTPEGPARCPACHPLRAAPRPA